MSRLEKAFKEGYEAGYVDAEGYILESIPMGRFNELRKSGMVKKVDGEFKLCGMKKSESFDQLLASKVGEDKKDLAYDAFFDIYGKEWIKAVVGALTKAIDETSPYNWIIKGIKWGKDYYDKLELYYDYDIESIEVKDTWGVAEELFDKEFGDRAYEYMEYRDGKMVYEFKFGNFAPKEYKAEIDVDLDKIIKAAEEY